MPCIYNIPKSEYRHCKLCTVAYCDERPEEQNTMSSTQYAAQQRIQGGEVSTIHEMTGLFRDITRSFNSDLIPIRFNGRLIKITAANIKDDPDYGYFAVIKFEFKEHVIR